MRNWDNTASASESVE